MCLIFRSQFVVDKVQTKINSSIKIVPNKKNAHHLKLNLYCLEMLVKRMCSIAIFIPSLANNLTT